MASLFDDPLLAQSSGGLLLPMPDIAPPGGRSESPGDALAEVFRGVAERVRQERAKSAEMGLWNDETGLPTGKGLLDATQQYTQGLLLGTSAPGIRAYHGSPHSFDRFSTERIGTGEGAQAYGHGLYFAEREGVAKGYRDKLVADQGVVSDWTDSRGNKFDMTALRSGSDPKAGAAAMLSQRGSVDEAIKDVKDWGPHVFLGGREEMNGVLSALEEFKAAGLTKQVNPGSMYEVNIAANPEHMLHWDKPLSEQHPTVRERLADVLRYQKVPMKNNVGGETTAAGMMQYLEDRLGKIDAANELASSGIPGIRYLDQGSRGAGEGSHNLVVFDDAAIEILRKYGLAGLMLGGGAAATQQQ